MSAPTKQARDRWKAARAKLDAIEAERAALIAPLKAEMARLLEPTDAALEAAKEGFIEAGEDSCFLWSSCENCMEPIFDGEPYTGSSEDGVFLCKPCSPTWKDFRDGPTGFVDAEGEPHTIASAAAYVEAHIAAGGSLDDSMARP